jgi:hypothetical protein
VLRKVAKEERMNLTNNSIRINFDSRNGLRWCLSLGGYDKTPKRYADEYTVEKLTHRCSSEIAQ